MSLDLTTTEWVLIFLFGPEVVIAILGACVLLLIGIIKLFGKGTT